MLQQNTLKEVQISSRSGISLQTIRIVKTELLNALTDPEVLPGYKAKVRIALLELSKMKGGVR